MIVGDGDLRPELERQAREVGAPVQLVGALDRAAVARAVAAADVVAVPSVVDRRGRVDGLPNTLLEALAAGRPVVASTVGGIPDVITDGVDGLLVPPQEPEAIARALTFLAGDAAARERLGAAGRRTVVERFSWDAAGAALERAYLAVAEQAQAPVRRRKISTPFRSKTTRQPAFRRSRATAAAAGSRALRSR
jgi:glycosyltransferase involved in cell wall biosynthesis